jgi:hypothetical protein
MLLSGGRKLISGHGALIDLNGSNRGGEGFLRFALPDGVFDVDERDGLVEDRAEEWLQVFAFGIG